MMMLRSSLYEVMMVEPWQMVVVVVDWVDLLLFSRFGRSGFMLFLSGCCMRGNIFSLLVIGEWRECMLRLGGGNHM